MKREIDGILLLDKPKGISSNAALQKVKYLFSAKKAGHTGSLDPLATGMLPICFGKATKLSQSLLDSDKTYWVQAKLGIRTTTSDSEGEILSERSVPHFTLLELDTLCNTFRGKILQIPSMYSALKYQGQPLYKLARKGQTVERKPREVTVYELTLLKYEAPILEMQIRCSKGTYIRTIVDDLGELLGCGAYVTELRRTQVGNFDENKMLSLAQLKIIYDKNPQDLDNYLGY